MKIRLIYLLIIFTLFASIHSIEVSGNVFGVWTVDNSPYYVIGDIVVPENETLSIEPGVDVIFNADIRLTVQGQLSAIGTETDSIRFTSETEWDRIRLENQTQMSYFEYCVIEKSQVAVHAIASPITISLSRIANTSDYGINIFGSSNQAETRIEYSKIHDTFKSGIHISQNSNTLIYNCEIFRCSSTPSHMGAIHLQSQGSENNPHIYYNHIHNNYKQGIIGWDITSNSSINPLIVGNVIENNLTGIYLRHASGVISYNIIRNNFIDGDTNSGAGIMLAGSSCTANVYGNTITGNYTGFYIGENASPILGSSNPSITSGHNVIMNNVGPNGNTNSIYLYNTSTDVNAIHNLFNSNNPEEIAQTIYDSNDNPSLGTVIFEPFLEGSLVQGNILNVNTDAFNEHWVRFLPIDNESEEVFAFTNTTEWSKIIQPGLYLVYVETFEYEENDRFKQKLIDDLRNLYLTNPSEFSNKSSEIREILNRLGFYGGFEEPTPLRVHANGMIEGVDISLVDYHEQSMIKYDSAITHNGQELIPMVLYDPYLKNKTQVLYLYDNEEDDFVYAGGFRAIHIESGQWQDYFFDEPTIFMKVRNVEINDQWTSSLYDYAIVRDINEEVIVDFVIQQDETDKTASRFFLTPNIGITQLKIFDIEECTMFSTISILDYPDFNQPNNLMPLAENKIFDYNVSDLYSFNPTSLTVSSNGLFMWDAPMVSNNYTEYRLYKDNQMFQSVDFSNMFYQVEPQDLSGTWYITAYSEVSGNESLPSNEVIITSIADEIPIPQTTNIRLYPNPLNLNQTDKLNFQLELSANDLKHHTNNLKLEIFNVKGQKIQVFNHDVINIKSNSIIIPISSINNSRLSSGIYFYRLTTDSVKITKKFLIIK